MASVTVRGVGRFRAGNGTRLLDVLTKHGIAVNASCGGRGRCGVCRIQVASGGAPPDAVEAALIPPSLLKRRYHLACRYEVHEDVEVVLPGEAKAGTRPELGLGLALDLGTTTLKGAAVDLKAGELRRQASILNPQNSLGGDVIARIGSATDGNYEKLRRSLLRGIADVKRTLGVRNPAFTAVVGNSVMLSFYLDKPVDGLAGHPFRAAISDGLFLRSPNRYVFPIIGGFVGGDTVAGLLASGLTEATGASLYVDLGTNGEVALVKPQGLVATSTAAGPAFEGVGIQAGSLAVPGAIDRVWHSDGIRYSTVAECEPVGICASGLIDALVLMLERGWMERDGRVTQPLHVGGFVIDQGDVRNMQLAVAAVRSGIELLLEHTGVSPGGLERVVITGEFGANLNTEALKTIGIVPREVTEVRFERDLPLKGAVDALLDNGALLAAERIAREAKHLDLAAHPRFQETFVSAMRFAPWP